MDNSHRGVSFFRIALIGLLLASVWVTVRRFRSDDRHSTQLASGDKEYRQAFEGRLSSLATPNEADVPRDSLSDSIASDQSYIKFLMSITNETFASHEEKSVDLGESPKVDQSQEQLADQKNVMPDQDPVQSIEPNKTQDIDPTEGSLREPQAMEKAVDSEIPGTAGIQSTPIVSDSESNSDEDLLVENEIEPDLLETSEDDLTNPPVESLNPESMLADGTIQSNPFASPEAGEIAPQAPGTSQKKSILDEEQTSLPDDDANLHALDDESPDAIEVESVPNEKFTANSERLDSVLKPTIPPTIQEDDKDNDPAVWDLTLRDAIEIGLSKSPDVTVANYSPAIANSIVGIEQGAFDPIAGASFYGGQDDRLARSEIQTYGAPSNFIQTDFLTPDNGLNNLYVKQRLSAGGFYEVGVGGDYQRFSPVGSELIVPSGWDSSFNVQFTQPLFRGFGRAATQQRILVAQAQSEQASHEADARMRDVVRDIELAYWELAAADSRLRAATQYVALGTEFQSQEEERKEKGLSSGTQQLQTRSVLSEFLVAVERAKRDRNIAEMKLRTAMGIANDFYQTCGSLTGVPMPTELPIRPNLEASVMPVSTELDLAVAKSMTRPQLSISKARIYAAQHNLAASKNAMLPQLNASTLYRKTGLEKSLDQSVGTMIDEGFDTWALGLTLEQNVFRRSARSSVRQAQLTIAQEQARINSIANEFAGQLRQAKADLEGSYQLFVAQKEQVDTLRQQIASLDELYENDKISLFQRLEIARALQAAELEAVESWGQMQAASARWRYSRGDFPQDYGVLVKMNRR